MHKQQGFSLIELLLVVAIILIISAIAVPSLIRSRIAANESSAVASLRAIINAENTYASLYPTIGFSSDLIILTGTNCTTPTSTSSCFIDNTLAQAISPGTSKSGYYYTYRLDSGLGFTLLADPAVWNNTGRKHLYTDASGIIHFNANGAGTTASLTDPTIQ